MKRIGSMKYIACTALLALACLGATPPSAYATVIINGRLDILSPLNPMGLRSGCHYEVHRIRLTAGTTYVIHLDSIDFDPYLMLSGFGVLIRDDDSGGNLNARIIFTPDVTGTYNIYATTFARGVRGSYRLSVTP
jgi:hypothetical protein